MIGIDLTKSRVSTSGTKGDTIMEQKGLLGGFYQISEWVMRLAYVNLLWILFTLLGGIIFGAMPATVAAFTIARKWTMDKEEEIPVFKTFWESYRRDFVKSNLLGLFLLAGGVLLYLYHANLDLLPSALAPIFKVIFYSVVLIYGFIVAFIFPVFVHYNVSMKQYFLNALVISLSFPHFASLNLFILMVTFILFQYIPILAVFFGISINVILIMRLSYIVFAKIALKQNSKKDEYSDKSEQLSI
jgi:uncharacterized membrane protein YesL